MKFTDRIALLPTQYRRASETHPLRRGHYTPKLAEWSLADGFTQGEILEYSGEALACPVVAVVDNKFGNRAVTLTITAQISSYKETEEIEQGDYTLKRKVYEPTTTEVTCTLRIPPYTRPWATFVLAGLGMNVYKITNITADVSYDTGKVTFYGLASTGSKIIYWLGIHNLAQLSREILQPWIAPPICNRCSGTGIEPGTTDTNCLQCKGYKYDGYNAVKWIQQKLGADVGVGRDSVEDWTDLTVEEAIMIKKFINKAWTQKWWCTPTVREIKRMFAHFYNLPEDNIDISERFNAQEPVWTLNLPYSPDSNGPFGTFNEEDRYLMRYIARSVTPAGVSVFVGFYKEYFFGNLDDFEGFENFSYLTQYSSIEHDYELWGEPRFDFLNGWNEATHTFEGGTGASGAILAPWTINGDVQVVNPNDCARHVARLYGNAYMEAPVVSGTGSIELWTHPESCLIRYGVRDALGWVAYIDHNLDSFYDNHGNRLRYASRNSDYHLSMEFRPASGASGMVRCRILHEDYQEFDFVKVGTGAVFRVQTYGTGAGYVDCISFTGSGAYALGDNWARLWKMGWGEQNEDVGRSPAGIIKVINLYNDYFKKDRFFDVK
jgi:hypothetical protein